MENGETKEQVTAEAVTAAVRALHHSPDGHAKEAAAAWLDRLQKSIHSWRLSDELLHMKADVESCYFAAQTMRSKIRHSFAELPPESHPSLRDSLLLHVAVVTAATDSAVATQLCLALADLALQMPDWADPVDDLIAGFAASNPRALLEILTVIPEEVCSSSLRLGENRRKGLKRYLAGKAPAVDALLARTLEASRGDARASERAINCLTSWISVDAVALDSVSGNPALAVAFEALRDRSSGSSLHNAAADCVCALLQRLEPTDDRETERLAFDGVAGLEKSYHLAVAHEDQEKAANHARVFTELAESFLLKIVNHRSPDGRPHFAIESLDLTLVCVGHHDYEIAEISFNLWYRLSEELYNKNDDALSAVYKPYIERLITSLCRHCQMEPDHRGLLDKDEDFYEFRQKVNELTKDVVFIIGSSHCFRQLFLSIQTQDISWERTEAALFIMQAVVKNILPEEYEYVPKVIEAVLAMPDNVHIAIKNTSILLLGELCDWIEKHPECIPAISAYLFKTLQNPMLASVTAHSLQSICSACRSSMQSQLAELLQIICNLDMFKLTTNASIELIKGVTAVIGCLPHEQVTVAMLNICSVQIAPLVALNEQASVGKETKADPVLWLDRIATLFRHCRLNLSDGETHPCLPVLNELWPALSDTMDRYCADLRIMERLCRCLRFTFRSLGKHGKVLLDPLSKKMIAIYTIHRHSCFLYLASILVDEFYGDPSCTEGLMEMLQSLIMPTFELLQIAGLVQHPDTVDDLFRLCTRYLQRIPATFILSPVIDSILQCGLMACSLDHKDANSSVMKFFCDFIHNGRTTHEQYRGCKDHYGAKLAQHGEALVTSIIYASAFLLRPYMLHDVAGVLYELLKWNKSLFQKWMENGLSALGQKSTAATPLQLIEFHKLVLGAETEKTISEALRDFVKLYH